MKAQLPTQPLCSVSLSPAAGRLCAAAPVLTENSHKVQFSHSSLETLHKFLLPCPSFAGTKRRFTRPQAAPLTVLAGINRHGQQTLHSISITHIAVSEDPLFNRNVPQMCHYDILEKNHNQPTNQPTHKKPPRHHTTTHFQASPMAQYTHFFSTSAELPSAVLHQGIRGVCLHFQSEQPASCSNEGSCSWSSLTSRFKLSSLHGSAKWTNQLAHTSLRHPLHSPGPPCNHT